MDTHDPFYKISSGFRLIQHAWEVKFRFIFDYIVEFCERRLRNIVRVECTNHGDKFVNIFSQIFLEHVKVVNF